MKLRTGPRRFVGTCVPDPTQRAGRTEHAERNRENPRCVRSRVHVFVEAGNIPARNVTLPWLFSRRGRRCSAVVAGRLADGAQNGGCGGIELVWESF